MEWRGGGDGGLVESAGRLSNSQNSGKSQEILKQKLSSDLLSLNGP